MSIQDIKVARVQLEKLSSWLRRALDANEAEQLIKQVYAALDDAEALETGLVGGGRVRATTTGELRGKK